ncbi:MAG: hypothetical protein AYK19_07165 [Theionarchaea archaeon DG-70-1]|nr:MAG: hypothetical protein AYK19_07165 [Theionarchaea archaeon DG-70-1]
MVRIKSPHVHGHQLLKNFLYCEMQVGCIASRGVPEIGGGFESQVLEGLTYISRVFFEYCMNKR